MKYLISTLLCLLLVVTPSVARSDPTPVTHEGKPGVWFPSDEAKKLLEDLKRLQQEAEIAKKLQERLDLEKRTNELLKQQIETERKIAETWENAAREQANQRAQADKWYRSPYFWAGVGLVVGGALVIGAGHAK